MSGWVERQVRELTKRVQRIHNGDFVTLLTQGKGWICKTTFTEIRGAGLSQSEALMSFAAALEEMEKFGREAARLAKKKVSAG